MFQMTVFQGVLLGRPGSLRMSFADNVTMLVLEEPTPLVSSVIMDDVVIPEGETNEPSDVVPDVIAPPPGFPPFSWLIARDHVAIEQSGSPLSDGGSPDVLASHSDVESLFSPIAQDQDSVSVGSPGDVSPWWILVRIWCRPSFDLCLSCRPSTNSLYAIGGHRLLFRRRALVIVARPQYLGGGWLWRGRSWRNVLLSRSAHWGLVVLFGIRHTAVRTTTRFQGNLDCPCIIRGSLSGSGFRSLPAFW